MDRDELNAIRADVTFCHEADEETVLKLLGEIDRLRGELQRYAEGNVSGPSAARVALGWEIW